MTPYNPYDYQHYLNFTIELIGKFPKLDKVTKENPESYSLIKRVESTDSFQEQGRKKDI